jgi:hypothetical protein
MSEADKAQKVAAQLTRCHSISELRDVLRSFEVPLTRIQNGGSDLQRADPAGAAAWDAASKTFWAMSKQLPESALKAAGPGVGVSGTVNHGKVVGR